VVSLLEIFYWGSALKDEFCSRSLYYLVLKGVGTYLMKVVPSRLVSSWLEIARMLYLKKTKNAKIKCYWRF